jgi:hypothetical protein
MTTYATCGTCGFTWDDSQITHKTPVPGGRTPCEGYHRYDDDGEFVGLDEEVIAQDMDFIVKVDGAWDEDDEDTEDIGWKFERLNTQEPTRLYVHYTLNLQVEVDLITGEVTAVETSDPRIDIENARLRVTDLEFNWEPDSDKRDRAVDIAENANEWPSWP